MTFCVLESDQKTFEYFKKYVTRLEQYGGSCMELDNEIQAEEIRRHLIGNGFPLDNVGEKVAWIRKNGRPFRDYINTIKLAYVVWKCSGKAWQDISYEDFRSIAKEINRLKMVCLDTIF